MEVKNSSKTINTYYLNIVNYTNKRSMCRLIRQMFQVNFYLEHYGVVLLSAKFFLLKQALND